MRAPRLPDALLDRSIYPHAADDLRVLETHVSWIALAGPYAYKLKKPVRFDFLDYSTRARRLAACEIELALNRRRQSRRQSQKLIQLERSSDWNQPRLHSSVELQNFVRLNH